MIGSSLPEPPKRLSQKQFQSVVSGALKGGSMRSKKVQDTLKSNHAVKRAMAKSTMTEREAKTAFKALHEAGHLKGTRQKSEDAYRKAVRVGQKKGVFEHKKTLHEIAVEERHAKRLEKIKKDERREENLARYEAEKAAEEGGVQPKDKAESVVVMQKHGVAAQADAAREQHSVGVQVAKKGESVVGLPGSTTSKGEKPQQLNDIMFD